MAQEQHRECSNARNKNASGGLRIPIQKPKFADLKEPNSFCHLERTTLPVLDAFFRLLRPKTHPVAWLSHLAISRWVFCGRCATQPRAQGPREIHMARRGGSNDDRTYRRGKGRDGNVEVASFSISGLTVPDPLSLPSVYQSDQPTDPVPHGVRTTRAAADDATPPALSVAAGVAAMARRWSALRAC
jgi:hypothetical protein